MFGIAFCFSLLLFGFIFLFGFFFCLEFGLVVVQKVELEGRLLLLLHGGLFLFCLFSLFCLLLCDGLIGWEYVIEALGSYFGIFMDRFVTSCRVACMVRVNGQLGLFAVAFHLVRTVFIPLRLRYLKLLKLLFIVLLVYLFYLLVRRQYGWIDN